ncbi:hypothetical protein BAUCODRAFT_239045 [Baudoinia panamericana UAMH 10762]|uniref:Alpha/beta hydrolase fold-3 domain-containing protein n=1 Tax=Baudoinia panamericana (strain UAMH 10762) TaxID=717646 RepID=M2N3U1_BAUPA|nr:uncharacterized protein BAUCODRAFT_239045 [Baudoinia panamericana UAMH 10762]EMC93385.1 hypothetical protein BAUCODRAFT_239045 [Baudoinia panamericana UAMH 10762]
MTTMTPSKESGVLTDLFRRISAHSPTTENIYLERVLYDQVESVATEVPDTSYEDITLPGEHHRPAKWIMPLSASSKHAILFMHGGGYTFGSLTSHRKLAAHLAKACNTWALMVDYRLAPESPFPAAIDDCVNAYRWLLDQGFEGKHIVTAGDSCGGGLATSVPLKIARDGLPAPGAAVSLSPWYDTVGQTSESLKTNADNDVLNTVENMAKLRERYTKNGADPNDPLISALYAADNELSGLPPHWISAAGYDMLRSDSTRMANKLKQAGVEVILKVHDAQQHVFEFMAGRAPEADQSIDEIGKWVRGKIGS